VALRPGTPPVHHASLLQVLEHLDPIIRVLHFEAGLRERRLVRKAIALALFLLLTLLLLLILSTAFFLL